MVIVMCASAPAFAQEVDVKLLPISLHRIQRELQSSTETQSQGLSRLPTRLTCKAVARD